MDKYIEGTILRCLGDPSFMLKSWPTVGLQDFSGGPRHLGSFNIMDLDRGFGDSGFKVKSSKEIPSP